MLSSSNINAGTLQDYDIRSAYPGDDLVDVISNDCYNDWPFVTTADAFTARVDAAQATGVASQADVLAWTIESPAPELPIDPHSVTSWTNPALISTRSKEGMKTARAKGRLRGRSPKLAHLPGVSRIRYSLTGTASVPVEVSSSAPV